MASPTLSSPTLVAGTPIWSFNALPDLPMPPPTASSRGFHVLRPPRKAHTDRIGFLHLPDNVRTKIYRLAIFDHDRGAVFLPRACPRKVHPGVDDLDVEDVDTSWEKLSLVRVWCRLAPLLRASRCGCTIGMALQAARLDTTRVGQITETN